MKKALIISGNQVQDQEFIYPYYRLLEENFKIDVCIEFNKDSQIKKSKFRVGNGIFLDDTDKKIAIQHKLFLGEFIKNSDDNLKIRGEVRHTIKKTIKNAIKSIAIKNYSYKEMLFHQLYRELVFNSSPL